MVQRGGRESTKLLKEKTISMTDNLTEAYHETLWAEAVSMETGMTNAYVTTANEGGRLPHDM